MPIIVNVVVGDTALEMQYDLGQWGKGGGIYYRMDDHGTDIDPVTKNVDEQRHRFTFSHQLTLRTNLTVKGIINEQSDPYVTRDYFEFEYRQHAQPPSFFEVNQAWPNFTSISLHWVRRMIFFRAPTVFLM